MTDRPRLYPGHRHQWTYVRERQRPDTTLVRCETCGFEAPRSLANLDGAMLNDAVYDEPDSEPFVAEVGNPNWRPGPGSVTDTGPSTFDIRCPHHTDAGQCLDHQGHLGDHQYPAVPVHDNGTYT